MECLSVPVKVFNVFSSPEPIGVTSIMSLDFYFLVPESFHTKFGSDFCMKAFRYNGMKI